jgi:curved DNA-binding protein
LHNVKPVKKVPGVTKRDPFDVLGVPDDADEETVKRAFRALVREHHPDVSQAPDADRRFRELIDAYERVAVPRGRRGRRREDRVDLSDIVSFYAWLASKRGRPPPVEVPLVELELSPGEAVRGVRRTIELDGPEGERRTITVEIPAGTWDGDPLTGTGQDGVPAMHFVARIRRRRGTGRLVQAVAVLALGYAVGLLLLILMR